VYDLGEAKKLDTFYEIVTLESSMFNGGIVDASTIQWWMEQDSSAKHIFNRPEQLPINIVLQRFTKWFQDNQTVRGTLPMFGNGPRFDNCILGNAYERSELDTPWQHKQDVDVRTMVLLGKDILGIDPKRSIEFKGVRHNALHDAIHQAKIISEIYRPMKNLASMVGGKGRISDGYKAWDGMNFDGSRLRDE
jgi:exodeoxyribonuclease VIII